MTGGADTITLFAAACNRSNTTGEMPPEPLALAEARPPRISATDVIPISTNRPTYNPASLK